MSITGNDWAVNKTTLPAGANTRTSCSNVWHPNTRIRCPHMAAESWHRDLIQTIHLILDNASPSLPSHPHHNNSRLQQHKTKNFPPTWHRGRLFLLTILVHHIHWQNHVEIFLKICSFSLKIFSHDFSQCRRGYNVSYAQ